MTENAATTRTIQDLVASDTGGRAPEGQHARILAGVALFWSVFQLWIASPLPFTASEALGFSIVLNDTQTRSIHLALALFLAFLAFPGWKGAARHRVPALDWLLGIAAAAAAGYLYVFNDALATRPGLPTSADLIAGGIGLVLLLEATRRALGPPLLVVAGLFLAYVFFGDSQLVPDVIQWKGASIEKALSHLWITTEGVFGVALGVSTSFVFLFVLFGALLDKAGAGNYFIQLAFALLGHLRGGPAKAAVLGSAMTGIVSGSSIANVVTTGTFTIPFMKRVGFSAEKAGSVEVASSVNGQLMPPVMGAAAFLMAEYIGIPYSDVVIHAFLPAAISYIALLYLVHLEALKSGMPALEKPGQTDLRLALLRSGLITASLFILAGLAYFGLRGMEAVLPALTTPAALLVLAGAYLLLLRLASRRNDLDMDDPEAPVVRLPIAGEVVMTGLHYLLPIVVLVWFLMVEQKSPGLSAFWACVLLIVILLTQRPLKAFFRGEPTTPTWRAGGADLGEGLVIGARNMIGIAVATATAGIVVGTVTLTGIGQVMTDLVEYLSGGNLLLGLVLIAIVSLILGMGLPTTANYIVVAALMAPVVVQIGAANGLVIPLIAVHMFVFYFGIMADVTPPVGLASYAAAAVSGGDPLKTGAVAFFYSLRTVLLPFLFVFNTNLLLIDVGFWQGVWIFIKATVAMLLFAAATQGFFLARSRIWENLVLLLVAFTLFWPAFWLDRVWPPYRQVAPAELYAAAAELPAGGVLRVVIAGPDYLDPEKTGRITLELPLAAGSDGRARLEGTGLKLVVEAERVLAEEPLPTSPLAERLRSLDFYGDQPVVLERIEIDAERPDKAIFYPPALLLLSLVVVLQRRRARVPAL